MTGATTYLCKEHVIAVHRRMIEEFGGEGGVRDHALLESATAMPAARFAGQDLHKGIAAKAAAYLFHLCKNHAFVDGNKRTALAAAEVFLRLNGCTLTATNKQLETLTIGVSDGTISKDDTVAFFRKHTRT